MKIKLKLILSTLLPALAVGVAALIIATTQVSGDIIDQAYLGMESTALAVRQIFETADEGEYWLDEDGALWKGTELNISEAFDMVDTIKENTGYDVTVFYGDTRMLTTIVNDDGTRAVGTQASDAVVEAVLGRGENFSSNDTEILGKQYIVYYIPFYQPDGDTPVGMVFLGEEYQKVSDIVMASCMKIVAGVCSMLVFALLLSLFMGTRISGAIKKANSYVALMSEGKLKIPMSDAMLRRRDEIGDMCRGVHNLDQSLQEIVTEIQDQSRALKEISGSCLSEAKKASTTTEEISKVIQQIAAAATSQARDTSSAEESVRIIGGSIENTNNKMTSFHDATTNIADASGNARMILQNLNDSMEQMENTIRLVQEETSATHASVEMIAEKTEVITNIASQTNLLSLNASIEAARAGEAGRGFSIVASEIRTLAEQCAVSVVEIQEALDQLKKNSDVSMNTMKDVEKIIADQSSSLQRTNEQFEVMEKGISWSEENISGVVSEIDILGREKENTETVMQHISTASEQNAANTEESAASIEEVARIVTNTAEEMDGLQKIAGILNEKVDVFQFL